MVGVYNSLDIDHFISKTPIISYICLWLVWHFSSAYDFRTYPCFFDRCLKRSMSIIGRLYLRRDKHFIPERATRQSPPFIYRIRATLTNFICNHIIIITLLVIVVVSACQSLESNHTHSSSTSPSRHCLPWCTHTRLTIRVWECFEEKFIYIKSHDIVCIFERRTNFSQVGLQLRLRIWNFEYSMQCWRNDLNYVSFVWKAGFVPLPISTNLYYKLCIKYFFECC